MHRTVETLNRPEPHLFVRDQDVPPDHQGRHFCCAVVRASQGTGRRRCALPQDDSVHVPAGEVYGPKPVDDIGDRIVGEGTAA